MAGFELADALLLRADFGGERFAGNIVAALEFALGGQSAHVLVIDHLAHFAGHFGDDFTAIVVASNFAPLRVLLRFQRVQAGLHRFECIVLRGEALLERGDSALILAALFIQPFDHARSLPQIQGGAFGHGILPYRIHIV